MTQGSEYWSLYLVDNQMISKSTASYKLTKKMSYQKINFRMVPHEISNYDNMHKKVEMNLSIHELL